MAFYPSTPSTIDSVSRMMQELFQQRYRPLSNTAFLAFFGNEANGSQSLFVDEATNVMIDMIDASGRISQLGLRGQGNVLDRKLKNGTSWKTLDRAFPIIPGGGIVTADMISKLLPGETKVTGSKSRYDRLRMYAEGIAYEEMLGQIWLMEKMASEAFLTGKLTVTPNGDFHDFGRLSSNSVVCSKPWDQAGADPIADITTICRLANRNGLTKCDFVGMDNASFKFLRKNDDFMKAADNRRYELNYVGQSSTIQPDSKYSRYIQSGWSPRAFVTTDNGDQVWIFTYDGFYVDDNGLQQDFMPNATVFATSTQARFDRYFGPADVVPIEYRPDDVSDQFFGIPTMTVNALMEGNNAIVDARMFHTFAWGMDKGRGIELEVQSAPLFAPTQVNAVAKMTSVHA